MNAKEITALFLLAALWGASFLFMRIASPAIGPVLTIELRVLIAGIVLLLYAWLFKKSIELKAYWKEYLIVGALNAAVPFTLIAAATLHLTASLAAVLNSTTPLFTALASRWFLHEPLHAKKWIGIGIIVSYWDSLETIQQWKKHAVHKIAQEKGKQQWYQRYSVRVCKVEQEYSFER